MPTIRPKYIVSFGSQDKKFVADNLLKGGKWLSSKDDKSAYLEIVIQFDKKYRISNVDIGTLWCLSIQLLVGQSSWPLNKSYETLVAPTDMMNPSDIRAAKNTSSVKMLDYDSLEILTRDQEWDRLKIILHQPLRKDVQMGINMLRLAYEGSESEFLSPSKELPIDIQDCAPSSEAKWKTPDEFQEHFLKVTSVKQKSSKSAAAQLAKIESSVANQGGLMSRTSRLVYEAIKKSPNVKPNPSFSVNKRDSFKEETLKFLRSLDFGSLNMEEVHFSDLRHMMEKQKHRKLSREEKKEFFSVACDFIEHLDRKSSDDTLSVPSECSKVTDPTRLPCGSSSINGTKTIPESMSKMMSPSIQSNLIQMELHNRNITYVQAKQRAKAKKELEPTLNGDIKSIDFTPENCKGCKPLDHSTPKDQGSYTPNNRDSSLLKHDIAVDTFSPIASNVLKNNQREESKYIEKVVETPGQSKTECTKNSTEDNNNVWLSNSSIPAIEPKNRRKQKTKQGKKRKAPKAIFEIEYPNSPIKQKVTTQINLPESVSDQMSKQQEANTAECPICFQSFPLEKISGHAAVCSVHISTDKDCVIESFQKPNIVSTLQKDSKSSSSNVSCPVCGKDYHISYINEHVNYCLA